MKKTILLGLLCSSFLCFSQQQKQIDSLKNVIDNYGEPDTTYVNLRLFYTRKMFQLTPTDSTILPFDTETLALSRKMGFKKGQVVSLNRIGIIHQYVLSDPFKAIENYQKSLTIVEENDLPSKYVVGNIGNIANIYYEQKENRKALGYYMKMLEYPAYRMHSYGYIGNIYGNLKKPDSAIYYYQKVDKIARETNNVMQLSNNLSNMSSVLSDAKRNKEAVASIEEALALIEKYNIGLIRAPAYSNAVKVYLENSDYSKAEKYALDALNLEDALDNLFVQEKLWENLTNVYEAKKDYPNAFEAYKKYVKLNDSITSSDRKLEISRKEIQYEADKENAIAKLETERQRLIKNITFAGGGLLFLAGLGGYFMYKRKRDATEEAKIADFKTKVAETELKALRSQMNPHFIFNSLNSISDYMDKNDVDTANEYLVKFSKLTRAILENSEKKWVPLKEDLELLDLYMQLESLRLPNKLSHSLVIDEHLDLENTMVPPLMLQPFVENSIWHGIAKKDGSGSIKITAAKEGESIVLKVDDDGVGRSNKTENKEGKTSLGLKITKSRLEVINALKKVKGAVKIIDKPVGVQVVLELPLELRF